MGDKGLGWPMSSGAALAGMLRDIVMVLPLCARGNLSHNFLVLSGRWVAVRSGFRALSYTVLWWPHLQT